MNVASSPNGGLLLALRKLQQLADTTSIRPSDTSSEWLKAASVLALNDPGILAVLGPNKLSCFDHRSTRTAACVDQASLVATALAVSSMRQGQKLALSVAPGARHLPLFVAAVAILGDTVRDVILKLPSSTGVLLISSDLDLRARYTSLQIASASIDAVYPGCRLNSHGQLIPINAALRRPIDQSAATVGVCFMYPTKNLPESVDPKPRYVIIDFRYGRESTRSYDILEWTKRLFPSAGVLALYTAGDAWTENEISRAIGSSCGFDHQAVQTCRTQLKPCALDQSGNAADPTLNASFANALIWLDRNNELRCSDQPKNLACLFAAITGTLAKAEYSDPALRRAQWLLSTLRDFPLPLVYYERAAHAAGKYTLKRMIDGLQQLLKLPVLGPLVQSLSVIYTEIYKMLLDESPRVETLSTAIEDAFLSQDASIVVLCKDATAADALELWFQDTFSSELELLSRVSAVKYSNAWALQNRDVGVVVLSGIIPFQHRWLYGGNLGRSAIHLCASNQIDHLQRSLSAPADPLINSRFINSRYRTLSTIIGRDVTVGGADSPIRGIQVTEVHPRSSATVAPATTERPPETASLAPGENQPAPMQKLNTLERNLEMLEALLRGTESGDQELPFNGPAGIAVSNAFEDDEPEDETSQQLQASRRILGLRDGQRVEVYLDELRHYEVILHGGSGGLVYLYPPQLSPGDTLLLTDSIGRLSVFEQMLSIIEAGPALKGLISYRRAWNVAVRQLKKAGSIEGYLDSGLLLRMLKQHGADIESDLTVRNWIDGSVIGPQKITSIVAVGKLIGALDMVERAAEYDLAFRSIRSIHQTLGKQISNIMRGAKETYASDKPGIEYDAQQAFSLPLQELMQSITPIVVEHVDENTASTVTAGLHHVEAI